MSFGYELKLSPRPNDSRSDPLSTFYWPAEGPSSFATPFGPCLVAIGEVPAPNVDLVRLALLVYAADRSTIRKVGTTNWSNRDFSLTVPVSDAQLWDTVSGDLASLLSFLTGDTWGLGFRTSQPPKEKTIKASDPQRPSRVVLMSGGADSALGVLKSRQQLDTTETHTLVSHVGHTVLAPIQRAIAECALDIVPGASQLIEQIRVVRRQKQVDGSPFKNEASSRSRSFLFLALGLAYASVHGVPVWIPDNGFTSLNPPLTPNRRGSLSTRSTHPAFLLRLSRILERIGAHSTILNPFAHMTKGEMFRVAANRFGETEISNYLSATHSCGLTGQRSNGISTKTQCGICFGCVVRRAAFAAGGLNDLTTYADASHSAGLAKWLQDKSVLPDVRQFVRRGVTPLDLLSMNLPDDYSLSDARRLCMRGLEELRKVVS